MNFEVAICDPKENINILMCQFGTSRKEVFMADKQIEGIQMCFMIDF